MVEGHCRFRRGVGLMSWFDDNLVSVVGDGTKSLFWIDHWLKGYVLLASLKIRKQIGEGSGDVFIRVDRGR